MRYCFLSAVFYFRKTFRSGTQCFVYFPVRYFVFIFIGGYFFLSLPHSARECLHVEGCFFKKKGIFYLEV